MRHGDADNGANQQDSSQHDSLLENRGAQIGFEARIVIARSDEIRLQYFDSRLREHDGESIAVSCGFRKEIAAACRRCGDLGHQLAGSASVGGAKSRLAD